LSSFSSRWGATPMSPGHCQLRLPRIPATAPGYQQIVESEEDHTESKRKTARAKAGFQEFWGDRWGSNPRQPESQSGTLPTELRSPLFRSQNYVLPRKEQGF